VSHEQSEGVGARVRRSIGGMHLRNLDPFLLLDEFSIRPPAGFPDHPHRGFETVTYVLEGKTAHEDFAGHKGLLTPGDLQWMTAGRGIVHAEMPATQDVTRGLQLWVNLPSHAKMMDPRYQEMVDKDVPRALVDKGETATVKVVAGEAFGVAATVRTITPILYLDVHLQPGKCLEHEFPESYTGFVYVLTGHAKFGGEEKFAEPHTALVTSHGTKLRVEASDKGEVHYVVIGGEPIKEPVAQYGPFVMNTQEELQQAMMDYQTAMNGFERARNWESVIGQGFKD